MERYVCENVFVPLRSGPSHKTEMLSQVLFGERYTIAETAGNWIRIDTLFDQYTGWVDNDHLQHSLFVDDNATGMVLNKSLLCHKDDGSKLVLEAGCEIFNPDYNKSTFQTGSTSYKALDLNESFTHTSESLADTALRFINSPYIWGGRIPSGIDCSGLTQLVYKIHGVAIPRDSSRQAEVGRPVDFIDSTEPGDLVFFDNEQGSINHVGMIFSKGLVIHASGRVRIDRIDHMGIFKPEKKGYSHKLRLIRRIL